MRHMRRVGFITAAIFLMFFTACGGNNNKNDGDQPPQQTYSVSFNTYGGSSVTARQVQQGGTVSEPAPAPTRDGYIFDGWYGDSGFTNRITFPVTVNQNLTLYARWTPQTYTVTFNSNGGSNVQSMLVQHGDEISAPASPTRADYNFDGWYGDSGFTNRVTFPYTVTQNITLYAKWKDEQDRDEQSVKTIVAGYYHTLAIKTDGSLWAWGKNDCGQLGDGTTNDRHIPIKIMDSVESASAGFSHTAAIKTDGSLWTWGNNGSYNLGDGTTEDRHTPVKIMDSVESVSAGFSHTAAIKTDGSLWAWGMNYYGQLGDGTTTSRSTPVKIMDSVESVSAGGDHTTAIKIDGSLWAWGMNNHGQLGDGTTEDRHTPVKIMDSVESVSAGGDHTLAIKTDGSLWAWGMNDYGQLGDGTTTSCSTPVKIMDSVESASAGLSHTAAIKTDGSLWKWGLDVGSSSTPVKIMDYVTTVSAGSSHTVVIATDGSLWAWGYNAHGQLGDGTTESHYNAPVRIIVDYAGGPDNGDPDNPGTITDIEKVSIKYLLTSPDSEIEITIYTFDNYGKRIRSDTFLENGLHVTSIINQIDKTFWGGMPLTDKETQDTLRDISEAQALGFPVPEYAVIDDVLWLKSEYNDIAASIATAAQMYINANELVAESAPYHQQQPDMWIADRLCKVYAGTYPDGIGFKIATWNGLLMLLESGNEGFFLEAQAVTFDVPDNAFNRTTNITWID